MRESLSSRKARAAKIFAILRKTYPAATTALDWSNPLELLVATILSAQCTDVRVNKVAPALFAKYRTAEDYAKARREVLEGEVRSTGFFRNKARNIRLAAAIIADQFGGRVPDNMDDLLTLPGVARKTANVVLGTAFGRNDGIVVDTHVTRLANRLGLTVHADNRGDRIEKDLMAIVPRPKWTAFSHSLVWHGRAICKARGPNCTACPAAKLCPSAGKV